MNETMAKAMGLIKEKIFLEHTISHDDLKLIKIDIPHLLADRFILSFDCYCRKITYIETIYHVEPWDWWEHFKLRWFPKWWLKRYPIKQKQNRKIIEFNLTQCFPDISSDAGQILHLIERVSDALD